MATLIFGPTCSGKSTYIKNIKTGVKSANILFGTDLSSRQIVQGDLVHYNLLHYKTLEKHVELNEAALLSEPLFQIIIGEIKVFKRVVILVASKKELIRRAKKRVVIEPHSCSAYDSEFWAGKIKDTNLFHLYEILFDLLDRNGIRYEVFYSDDKDNTFLKSDRVYVYHNLRGVYIEPPTSECVNEVLADGCFHYQTLLLPGGIVTSAKDYSHLDSGRGASFQYFVNDIANSGSVLDIGSAIGELPFLVERLGCEDVLGLEPHGGRFSASLKAKAILMSRVEFLCESFDKFSMSKTFDSVVALNVIHHVSDYDSFIRKAAHLAKKYLVLEYPTLLDKKFLAAYGLTEKRLSGCNDLPLIGVSSLSRADQTYVFSPIAIEALVMNEIGGFAEVNHFKSPIDSRSIMVFRK